MKKFNSKSCEEIMTTVYKPIEYVVDGLIAQGLYILAGAPKVGKSWLALKDFLRNKYQRCHYRHGNDVDRAFCAHKYRKYAGRNVRDKACF